MTSTWDCSQPQVAANRMPGRFDNFATNVEGVVDGGEQRLEHVTGKKNTKHSSKATS
jgi:hypothetical protein